MILLISVPLLDRYRELPVCCGAGHGSSQSQANRWPGFGSWLWPLIFRAKASRSQAKNVGLGPSQAKSNTSHRRVDGHDWPMKWVKTMQKGFDIMSTMNGNQKTRFIAAFPHSRYPKGNPTWQHNFSVWKAASEELKQKFVDVGYEKAGEWKTFREDVLAANNGTIPSARQRIASAKLLKN
jgi:hypothetical protein